MLVNMIYVTNCKMELLFMSITSFSSLVDLRTRNGIVVYKSGKEEAKCMNLITISKTLPLYWIYDQRLS